MESFVSTLTVGAFVDAGGWITLVLFLILLSRQFQQGKLLTLDQHEREISHIDTANARLSEQRERHFVELLATKRLAWQSTIDTMKDSFENQLADSQANVHAMLDAQRTLTGSVERLAHAAQVTERLIGALDGVLELSGDGGAPDGGRAARPTPPS